VSYVLVPAVVTDKSGKHVLGLKKEDFHLSENGKEQKIVSLEEINAADTPVPSLPVVGNEISNQPATDGSPRRLVIIGVDLVNTPIFDQYRARQAVISYLAQNIDPASLYQLVAIDNNGLRVLHDFTADTAGLVAALKNLHSRFATLNNVDTGSFPRSTDTGATRDPVLTLNMAGIPDFDSISEWINGESERAYGQYMSAAAARSTLLAFEQIAERASGIPGRKSLVWITGSFPFSIDPGSASVNEGVSFEAYQHVMQLLSDQQISVYPIDARGLLTTSPDASMHLVEGKNGAMAAYIANASNRLLDTQQTMRAFADMTGGHAYVNNNDIRGALRDAVHDGSAYYVLAYAVDKSDLRPGWRKVSVKAGDYNVRARRGYFLTQTTLNRTANSKQDMDTALTSPLDYTGLHLRVKLDSPVVAGNKRKMTFAMLMPPKTAKIDSGDSNHLNLDIAYVVWTTDGKDAAHKGISYNLNLNPTQLQQIDVNGVSYGDTVELTPGGYKLRVVVRDNLTGRMGSVSAPLNVK
jgi:VWFA-related protein